VLEEVIHPLELNVPVFHVQLDAEIFGPVEK
jgi:hypothetical protein